MLNYSAKFSWQESTSMPWYLLRLINYINHHNNCYEVLIKIWINQSSDDRQHIVVGSPQAFDYALFNYLNVIFIEPTIWGIGSSNHHMMIFLISNFSINWSLSNTLILIYISSTTLRLNFKSIALMLTESWPSKDSTYTHGIRSIQELMQFMKCKVIAIRNGRIRLFFHSSQQ